MTFVKLLLSEKAMLNTKLLLFFFFVFSDTLLFEWDCRNMPFSHAAVSSNKIAVLFPAALIDSVRGWDAEVFTSGGQPDPHQNLFSLITAVVVRAPDDN